MNNSVKNKIKLDIFYYFYKNYNKYFYRMKKLDRRCGYNKNFVIGTKMNNLDFEKAIENIINNIENDNNINLDNNDNIVNNIIQNIIDYNQLHQNYESEYLYLKMKDNIMPNSKFSFKSFKKKYNLLKQDNNPFYLLLYPNYEWSNLIIGLN
jgi:hypothetical protein